jgi:NTP pyrophosphatase (non-canonical NTP hydrolase)
MFPEQTPRSCASHLLQEAAELYCAPSPKEAQDEAADCLMLLVTFAARSGFSLAEALEHKFARVQQRSWARGADGLMHAAGSVH